MNETLLLTKETTTAEDEEDMTSSHNITAALLDTTGVSFDNLSLFLLLLSFSAVTIFGNGLVIIAVLRERALHTATNYFITSLAVSDGLVGAVVMPFSAFYEAMGQKWIFGENWCDGWHSFDVLASTASILNLCVISLDRYWAITDPMTYPAKMTRKKAGMLIITVWVCSAAISFPAIAWWRATDSSPNLPLTCTFTEDMGYLIFSSLVSFYGPLAVMLFTYYRIYKAAVAHTRSLRIGAKQMTTNGLEAAGQEVTLRIHRGGNATFTSNGVKGGQQTQMKIAYKTNKGNSYVVTSQGFNLSRKLAKFSKEKKAAKTLGTVMGIFIICWLPFFVTNIVSGFCIHCLGPNPEFVFQIVTWLGWLNSSMNPCIYACCSKDFSRAFKRILCCQKMWGSSPNRPDFTASGSANKKSTIQEFPVLDGNVSANGGTKASDDSKTCCLPKFSSCGEKAKNQTMLCDTYGPMLATLATDEVSQLHRIANVKRNSMYSIPPPSHTFDARRSSEKLL